MIKIIDSLYLTEVGCCIKSYGKFTKVHIRQGEMDGACAVYALMMNLLILKTIRRNQLEDLFNKMKKSPEVERLFHEFFDKHGLVRDGFHFKDVCGLTNRTFGDKVTAKYDDKDSLRGEKEILDSIKNTLDSNMPIILGIDFKGGGGHAVVAIGYESDDEGLFNIFCMDPGYDIFPTSYWNMVISLDIFNGHFKHQCLTVYPNECSAINISDVLRITKN